MGVRVTRGLRRKVGRKAGEMEAGTEIVKNRKKRKGAKIAGFHRVGEEESKNPVSGNGPESRPFLLVVEGES